MPKDSLVLVDTSVWISYFHKDDSHIEHQIDRLLESDALATAGIVLAELIQGSRGEKEKGSITQYFSPLHFISSNDSHWKLAGELSYKLRKAGKSVNLTDCYIAGLAHTNSALVFSLDKHFKWIAEMGECEIYSNL